MKCMANQDESVVVRVTEDKAKILQEEGFHFIPKEVWKKKVRDAEQPVEDKPIKSKSNKMSKAQKRQLRKKNKK